ncbi:MAG: ABC transporter permease [Bdellovibrionaceae bacterium]|nr:ABC transporter permease [Pseudobdellovibrionaceae bacterium]
MLRNIFILVLNDFAIAFRNKSFYLIIFIPVFIFVSLRLTDKTGSALNNLKIGLVRGQAYAPQIVNALQSVPQNLEIKWVTSEDEAQSFLREHKIDAVLVKSKMSDALSLLVLRKESAQSIASAQMIATLQKSFENAKPSWVSEVRSLREGSMQKQTLPTWILMVILLVAFIILPAQVAEEKEKRQLLAILQTPIHELEWIAAKILTGIGLCLISVFLLQFLGQVTISNFTEYLAFVILGGYCFCAFGILLGFLCRSQASARTLGLVFYLPLMMPAALSDFSTQMSGLFPILPTYQFYEPIQKLLFENKGMTSHIFPWIYLFIFGSTLFGMSYLFLKKRWLIS